MAPYIPLDDGKRSKSEPRPAAMPSEFPGGLIENPLPGNSDAIGLGDQYSIALYISAALHCVYFLESVGYEGPPAFWSQVAGEIAPRIFYRATPQILAHFWIKTVDLETRYLAEAAKDVSVGHLTLEALAKAATAWAEIKRWITQTYGEKGCEVIRTARQEIGPEGLEQLPRPAVDRRTVAALLAEPPNGEC